MTDDREAFAAKQIDQAMALGRDAGAFRRAVDTVVDLDRYDYTYLWNWMGAPIIQWPADVMATQEAIWTSQPDVIVEAGVARGGSVLFLSAMLALLDVCGPSPRLGGAPRRVIGVDIDIRPHNRDTIEEHPFGARVELIEGSSIAPETLDAVRRRIPAGAQVMAILDSDHSRDHVLAELRGYAPMVTPGGYLVAADTLVGHLTPEQIPQKRSKALTIGDEPKAAVEAFLAETDDFEPDAALNAKLVLSSSPGGYLRRR